MAMQPDSKEGLRRQIRCLNQVVGRLQAEQKEMTTEAVRIGFVIKKAEINLGLEKNKVESLLDIIQTLTTMLLEK